MNHNDGDDRLKILLVSLWGSPPYINAQSFRIARIAKYLRKEGNEVTVFGRRLRAGTLTDSKMVSEMNKYGKVPNILVGNASRLSTPATSKILNLGGAPDNLIFSIPNYFHKLKKIINDTSIDCVLTSNTPSSYLIGALVKRDIRIPWIADFCDLWTGNPGFYYPTILHRYLQERIELKTLSQADGISYSSESWEPLLRKRYPRMKLCYTPNGFDSEEFISDSEAKQVRSGLTFSSIGTIYGDTDLVFLKAFIDFINDTPKANESVKMKIMGSVDHDIKQEIERLCKSYRNIEVKGLLTSENTIREIMESDFLVYDLGTGNTAKYDHMPGRLPLYIGSGKPTIACCLPGGVSDTLFRKFGCWRIVESGKQINVKGCYREAWDIYSSGAKLKNLKTWNIESKSLQWDRIVRDLDIFIKEVCR